MKETITKASLRHHQLRSPIIHAEHHPPPPPPYPDGWKAINSSEKLQIGLALQHPLPPSPGRFTLKNTLSEKSPWRYLGVSRIEGKSIISLSLKNAWNPSTCSKNNSEVLRVPWYPSSSAKTYFTKRTFYSTWRRWKPPSSRDLRPILNLFSSLSRNTETSHPMRKHRRRTHPPKDAFQEFERREVEKRLPHEKRGEI